MTTSWLGFANKLNPEDEDGAVEAAEVAFDALDEGINGQVSVVENMISLTNCDSNLSRCHGRISLDYPTKLTSGTYYYHAGVFDIGVTTTT